VIPFYRVDYGDRTSGETREQALAREMGRPPWELASVSASQKARKLADRQKGSLVGLVFDPCFFYSHHCWRRWVDALLQDGTKGKVDLPLGNQDPSWRVGLDVPLYLTLRGLEETSEFTGPVRWLERKATRIENFCVSVLPVSLLYEAPEDLNVGALPDYWVEQGQEVRIFCSGWLHSFNAVRDAGCRHDLLFMCDWHGRVLELGCDMGLMAGTCKESGSHVEWIGIDRNGERLGQARSFMDMAVLADINLPLPFSAGTKFDRIVCGDVLEHLPYPWDVLSGLRRWLRPDGLLVASVPNVGHWSVVEDLVKGRWDETPSGLFCVSHLRFGTKRSWERWFEKSGWQIISWEEERVPLPEGWILSPRGAEDAWDTQSLETVRYRLTAKAVS